MQIDLFHCFFAHQKPLSKLNAHCEFVHLIGAHKKINPKNNKT